MILYGAGGHGRVAMDCLNRRRTMLHGFFDDNESIKEYCGIQVMPYHKSKYPDEMLVISIGDNGTRKHVAAKVTHRFGNITDQSAIVANDVLIGEGTVIFHSAVVQAGTELGRHVIVNTSASVDHECRIGDFAHIGPNATLCGNVTIGEGTQIGAAAVVIPGVTVGSWSVIGAGAVVRENVPDRAVMVGNPGRIVKTLDK